MSTYILLCLELAYHNIVLYCTGKISSHSQEAAVQLSLCVETVGLGVWRHSCSENSILRTRAKRCVELSKIQFPELNRELQTSVQLPLIHETDMLRGAAA